MIIVRTPTAPTTPPPTDTEKRLLAWQGPFPPCSTCKQTQNHRCRTLTGNLTSPHKPRMDMATGYIARQPEVDELTRLLRTAGVIV